MHVSSGNLAYEMEEILEESQVLEKEFRDHYSLTKKEWLAQMDLVSRLWILSQRYILLKSTGNCCKYPEIYAGPASETFLLEFAEKLCSLRNSISVIEDSVNKLRKSCLTFEKLTQHLKSKSSLLADHEVNKPISFLNELFSDFMQYFHATILNIKCYAHHIDPMKTEGLEYYKTLIVPSEDFEEYFNSGLTYYKCLRLRNVR